MSRRPAAASRAAIVFRVSAALEAATWLGLLVGMVVKYAFDGGEGGVTVFGPIHGVVVLGYVAATLWAASVFGWGSRTVWTALLASVPPLGSVAFERWATRTRRLPERSVSLRGTRARRRSAIPPRR